MGFTSLYDVEILSLYEYSMRMKAYQLQKIDQEHDMHLQAWLNHQVTATKEQGKKIVSVFHGFKDFYDYEARINEITQKKTKITPQMRNMARIAFLVNSGKGVNDG